MMPKAISTARVTLSQLVNRQKKTSQLHAKRAASPASIDRHPLGRTSTPQAPLGPMPPAPKTPLAIASDMLQRSSMDQALRHRIDGMLATIPTGEQINFARHVVVVCAQVRVPRTSVVVDPAVLDALCAVPADHREFVATQAAACAQQADSVSERLRLVRHLATHHERLVHILPTVRPFILTIPTTAARATVIKMLGQTEHLTASQAEALLRVAEPFLPIFNGAVSDTLHVALTRIHHGNGNVPPKRQAQEDPFPQGPTVDQVDTLSDEQIHAILGEEACQMDARNYQVDTHVDGALVPLTLDRENVMQSRRHLAAIAAMQVIVERAPMPLAPGCIAPFVALTIDRLACDTRFREGFGLTQEESGDLTYVWRADKAYDDLFGPLSKNPHIAYLRAYAMGARNLCAQLYWAIQTFTNDQATWSEGATTRALMRTSFFRAMAQTYEPEVFEGTAERRIHSKRRVCEVGLVQRLLTALSGYYPYSLDAMQPEMLLTVLAQQAFGNDPEDEDQTTPLFVTRLLSFAENAQKRAAEQFGADNASDLATFKSQLFDYLSITFDFNLADGQN